MARAKGPRTERFNMMLAPQERASLDGLAKKAGVDASTLLRNLIKEAERTSILGFVRVAESPHKTSVARNKAIRGQYLDEIVAFAEGLDEAVKVWRGGDEDAAIARVLALERESRVIGVLSASNWAATFREHVDPGPGKRAKPAQVTTNQIVLALLDVDGFGRLDDGRGIIDRRSTMTRLGKRRGRRVRLRS